MNERSQTPVVLDYASQLRPRARWTGLYLIFASITASLAVLGFAMLVPSTGHDRGCARGRAVEAMVGPNGTIAAALESFRLQLGGYPQSLADLVRRPDDVDRDDDRWYQFVNDGIFLDPWGNRLVYCNHARGGQGYDLISCGPDGIPNTSDDITNHRR